MRAAHFFIPAMSALTVSWIIGTCAAQGTVTEPSLRDELVARVNRDQEARFAAIDWSAEHGENGIVDVESLTADQLEKYDKLQENIASIDDDNTRWLKSLVDERGWLTTSAIGVEASDALWLMVQHADDDPEFQRRCLDLMRELPAEEVSQTNVAMLTDRVLLAEGKQQVYGTQFVVRDGVWVPFNLADEEGVDARRESVGLPPMAEYREMLEAVMRGEQIDE